MKFLSWLALGFLHTGRGRVAERIAGVMKRKGHLWVLAPKAEFLERLKAIP